MNITLTPEQEKLIQAKMASGKFDSPDAVVQEAFKLLDQNGQAARVQPVPPIKKRYVSPDEFVVVKSRLKAPLTRDLAYED